MRALVDTHALLWWLSDDPALTRAARKIIAETKNTLIVSAASAWEIAIKVRLGKLPTATDLAADFSGLIEREGFQLLAISAEHGIRAGLLPGLTRTHLTVCSSPKRRPRIFPSSAMKHLSKAMACDAFGEEETSKWRQFKVLRQFPSGFQLRLSPWKLNTGRSIALVR